MKRSHAKMEETPSFCSSSCTSFPSDSSDSSISYSINDPRLVPCFLPINMGLNNDRNKMSRNNMSRNNTYRLIEPIATKRSADTIIGCNLSQEELVLNKRKLRRECDSIYNVAGYASNAASFAVNAGNFQLAVGGMSHCAACYCTCCNIRA